MLERHKPKAQENTVRRARLSGDVRVGSKKRHAGVSGRCPFLPIADIGCGACEMAARGTVGTGNAAPRGRPAALAMVSERPANENHIPLEVERIRILREFTRNCLLKEFFRVSRNCRGRAGGVHHGAAFSSIRATCSAGAGLGSTMRTLRRLVRKINHPNIAGYAHADYFPFRR